MKESVRMKVVRELGNVGFYCKVSDLDLPDTYFSILVSIFDFLGSDFYVSHLELDSLNMSPGNIGARKSLRESLFIT